MSLAGQKLDAPSNLDVLMPSVVTSERLAPSEGNLSPFQKLF